jgi:hypothetical protein
MHNMEEQIISVSVQLGNRSYRLKIPSAIEGGFRSSLHGLNKRYAKLRNSFPGRDQQDYLALCVLEYLAEQHNDSSHKSSLDK